MILADAPSLRLALYARRYMVVAGHPLAAMAGMRVLEAGGNAVDAGVAAGFALNVLLPDMANLGGVAPIVLRMANAARTTTFDGIGPWPALATLEAVQAAGNGRIPVSPNRWVVPAAVDSWLSALARYGTWQAKDVLQPAIELAREGFPANYFLANNIAGAAALIRSQPRAAANFMPMGSPPAIGTSIRQPELANTLERLAFAERRRTGSRSEGIKAARDEFYCGEIAARIDEVSRDVGAFLRADDLRNYSVREAPAISVPFAGVEVHGCGPWCQGPALLQMLRLAEALGIAVRSPCEATHLMIEAVKVALFDRNAYYGDPSFVDVPIERLLSAEYALSRAADIEAGRAARRHMGSEDRALTPDTTYVCVVDEAGNAFSATPSDSTILFVPMIQDLGFGISDRGHQASLDPSNPNAIRPGKRPRMTPNPGMIVGQDVVMPFGTPGGEVQSQAMFQYLVSVLIRGTEPQNAVEEPRWATYAVPATEDPHPFQDGVVAVEGGDPLLTAYLENRGHAVRHWPRFAALAGGICAIRRDGRTGVLSGAADPRRMSYGIGW